MAYLPLSTANLPDPAIDPAQGSSPEDYFNTVLYTGNNNNGQAVTGVGFQPDFVWIKQRTTAVGHNLEDAVRGAGKFLQSETAAAEDVSGNLISFDSDGFTVGTGNRVDQGTNAYVAWNWKANGSGVSNTDGEITSTVSANTTSGFSIITYTGNGASGQSVGHGLNAKPELVFKKNRSQATNWAVTTTLIDGSNDYAHLNLTQAFGNSAEGSPTSSVIPVYPNAENNSSGDNFICYAFHSVDGFSKLGSYTGNGSADGPFVYTGFRPAFLLFKLTNGVDSWEIRDDARDSFNPSTKRLYPSASASEGNNHDIDFVSNGFKLRNSEGGINGSGNNIIYMAFAENPFKYSNAR